MELPQYDQYSKWFGEGPMATRYGMDQMDLAKQFQNQKLQQGGEDLRATTLANQFDEQQNPQKLEEQRLRNTGVDFSNRSAGVDARIKEKTEPLQLDATQQDFVRKAKQSDLDLMQLNAQKMAYSPDPKISAEGVRMLQMHRDFLKLREQGTQKADLAADKAVNAVELEKLRQQGRVNLKRIPTAGKGGSGGSSGGSGGGISTDKLVGKLALEMKDALEAGDTIKAQNINSMINRIEQSRAASRGDTNAGKPTVTPEGLGTIPPRPAPQVPQWTPKSGSMLPPAGPTVAPKAKPTLPSGWVMKN